MSSDIPGPTPDRHVEDSWFQRPAVLATGALVVIIVVAVVWFLGREAETSTDPTAPSPLVTSEATATDATTAVEAATSGPEAASTPGIRLNPYGDVVGRPVV